MIPRELHKYHKNVVESDSGRPGLFGHLPTRLFRHDKFETLNQGRRYFKPGKKIKEPISVTYDHKDRRYHITDGANRTTQALVNKDKHIPAVTEIVDSRKGWDSLIKKPKNMKYWGDKYSL